MSKKILKKKISKKKNFFCENEKSNNPRFLGDFYYHGTINVPSISESMSIRNWVTFCANSIGLWAFVVLLRWKKSTWSYILLMNKNGTFWRKQYFLVTVLQQIEILVSIFQKYHKPFCLFALYNTLETIWDLNLGFGIVTKIKFWPQIQSLSFKIIKHK